MFTFIKYNPNQSSEKRFTVTKTGYIGVPSAFYKENNIASYSYVVLYYDKSQNTIGIKFTNNSLDQNKLKILKSNNVNGGTIVAKGFFKTYEIEPKEYSNKYNVEKYTDPAEGEMYVFTLKKLDKPVNSHQEDLPSEVGQL